MFKLEAGNNKKSSGFRVNQLCDPGKLTDLFEPVFSFRK